MEDEKDATRFEEPFNRYAELMTFLAHPDRTLGSGSPVVYAASCRWLRKSNRAVLETWPHALIIGQPLPTLPAAD